MAVNGNIAGGPGIFGSQTAFWNDQRNRPDLFGYEAGTSALKSNLGLLDGAYKRRIQANGQSIIIPGVRGDLENGWIVDIYIKESSGSDQSIFLRPLSAAGVVLTGLTSDSYLARVGTDASPIVISDASNWYIGTARANSHFHATIHVQAKSGVHRGFNSQSKSLGTPVTMVTSTGTSTETATEICRLEVRSAHATGIGVGSYGVARPFVPQPKLVIRPTDTILVTGDSLTEGYPQTGYTWSAGSQIEPAWDTYAGVLRRIIDAKCLEISGTRPTWRTSGVGGTKINALYTDRATRLGAYSADVVICAYGINDCNDTETADATFLADYLACIDYQRATKADSRWICVSPRSRGDKWDGSNASPAGVDARIENKTIKVAEAAASRTNCWFANWRSAWQEWEQLYNTSNLATDSQTYDGVHPVLPGQEMLAAVIAPLIQVIP